MKRFARPDRAFLRLTASLLAVALSALPLRSDTSIDVPVVDLHTHTFNVRDLPVVGILCAFGVPAGVAHIVGGALIAATPPLTADKAANPEAALARVHAPFTAELTEAERRKLIDYVGSDTWTRTRTLRNLTTAEERDADLIALVLVKAGFPPDEEPLLPADQRMLPQNLQASLPGYLRFIRMLTSHQGDIMTYLRHKAFPDGDLFVHHLMDMEVAYANRPVHAFASQSGAFTTLDRDQAGSMVHFSAFDPLRRDAGLPLVQDSWREDGTLGFKVYPPSGYKPAGNVDFPERPGMFRFGARRQWNARYRGWDPKDLNATLDGFFAWAETNRVPVFTHCTPWGFESVKGYGLMADPAYWAQVLKKHPNLILGLGHAGGGYFWFRPQPAADDPRKIDGVPVQDIWRFGREVADLCLKYRHVYAELGYHTELFEPGGVDAAYGRLAELLEQRHENKPWQLGDKIAYGTDWHMMHKTDGFENYPGWWDKVFQRLDARPGIERKWRPRFFAGNALRFIALAERLEDPRFAPEQQAYWRDLLHEVAQAEAR